LINRLDRRARYVGGHYLKPSFFGDVKNYDLILFVAIHAALGTPDSFFPHTHYGIFSEVRINDKPACEMDVYGAYLGEFGVPIGLVSGEDIAVRQALSALPWAKSVIVDKREETYTSGAKSVEYLSEGRGKLRAAAAEAVRNASGMKPLVLSGPIHFEVTFHTEKLADRYNTWDFDQEGKVVKWDADNMIEGFEKLNKVTFFPRNIYPVRRQIMFLMRVFYRLKNTYFAPKPNPEGAAFPT
ncbi:MAG: M55 family metallopeptidase, partial [Thermodesulfobacteriota bacterium]|nr:M55 family metallopeptidase [Thermodesulfobacteriota bacterium]